MDVRCKIERKGGSIVTMDKTTYHFTPVEEGGPHIASVNNQKHLARFLAIPEGYELFTPGANTAEDDEDGADVPATELTEPTVTEAAPSAEPTDVVDPQEALMAVLAAESAEDVTRADLDAAFELLHDRKPNPQAKDETVFDRIKSAAAELKEPDAAE